MRLSLLFIFTQMLAPCFAQVVTLTDIRDGQSYSMINANGTYWMLENLNFATNLSSGLTSEQNEKYNLTGRYYHMAEIDSVCPSGWVIPNVQDWINYYKFMVAEQYPTVKLEIKAFENPLNYNIAGYNNDINLFEEGNLLNLMPTGRYEGGVLNIPDVYADFWTLDEHEEFEGTTHIHIMNVWTTIHSHKHHLKPKQKRKLRKFMVRCIK